MDYVDEMELQGIDYASQKAAALPTGLSVLYVPGWLFLESFFNTTTLP